MSEILAFITTPLYIVFILLEIYLNRFSGIALYKGKDTLVSIGLGLCGAAMDFIMIGVCFTVINYISNHYAPFHIQSPVLSWIGVFIAQDFCFYWLHRVEHYCRFFWAVHVNHHSSNYFNFSVALRSSVLQPTYRYLFFLPCGFLGFSGEQVMFIYAVNQAYAFFVHTTTVGKLGWYEKLFVTPSHHRVHHGSNPQYLDKNMGQVLIIWDKIFGTYAEEDEKVEFGLTKKLDSYNLPHVIFHEWKNIGKDLRRPVPLKHKLMYVFGPPGWSHDGSSKTSAQLREEMDKKPVNAQMEN